MSSHGKKSKRQEVLDRAILAANVTKNASEMIAVLGPLKTSMGMLISLLESIKEVQTNEDNWESLVTNISAKVDLVRNMLKDKPESAAVHDLVFDYSGIPKKHRAWPPIKANNDAQKIKEAEKQMNEAFDRFKAIIIGTGIEALQNGHNDIIQTLASHSNDHAQSHARILQLHQQQQDMNDQLEDIQSKQKETISQLTEAEEINLIKGVSTASLANGGIHQICMQGTRLTVLEEARKWMVDDHAPQLFWLNGVAGSGKSTVAKQLSEEWKAKSRLAGRFFFSRDAEETRSPKLFFTTIAQQGLSHLGPAAQTAFALGIRKLRDPVSATLEEQCSDIFEAPLQLVQQNSVLILDALDECELRTCQQLLRILLPRLHNLPRLKIFLTSRPELHIREKIQEHTHHFLSFRIDAPENVQDVEIYMRRTVHGLSLPEEQMSQLIDRAGGLFIWAKTVCELLRNIRRDRDGFIRRVLAEGIRQMDSIYLIALEQATRNNEVEESMEAYMDVLKVVVAAYEPLSPDTINQLLNIPNVMEIVGDLRSVLECHGVEEPIRFLHPTFREFLLKTSNTTCFIYLMAMQGILCTMNLLTIAMLCPLLRYNIAVSPGPIMSLLQ
ncbi:3261_t:CDS:2, partial [Acaulospora colombiana]